MNKFVSIFSYFDCRTISSILIIGVKLEQINVALLSDDILTCCADQYCCCAYNLIRITSKIITEQYMCMSGVEGNNTLEIYHPLKTLI